MEPLLLLALDCLGVLHRFCHLILTANLSIRYYWYHYLQMRKMEAQVNLPRATLLVVELGSESCEHQ